MMTSNLPGPTCCRRGLWPDIQCRLRWTAGSRSTFPYHDWEGHDLMGRTWDVDPVDAGDCTVRTMNEVLEQRGHHIARGDEE